MGGVFAADKTCDGCGTKVKQVCVVEDTLVFCTACNEKSFVFELREWNRDSLDEESGRSKGVTKPDFLKWFQDQNPKSGWEMMDKPLKELRQLCVSKDLLRHVFGKCSSKNCYYKNKEGMMNPIGVIDDGKSIWSNSQTTALENYHYLVCDECFVKCSTNVSAILGVCEVTKAFFETFTGRNADAEGLTEYILPIPRSTYEVKAVRRRRMFTAAADPEHLNLGLVALPALILGFFLGHTLLRCLRKRRDPERFSELEEIVVET